MKRIVLVAGVAVLVAGVLIIKNKMNAQQDGTSNTLSPKTTKLTGQDKVKHSLSTHPAGTNERRILQLAARIDPGKAVSPDGRIWQISHQKHRVTGKGVWVVGGNTFDTRAKALQWVAAQG